MSIHPHKEREYCINGFKKKKLSISRSRTNGHPAVVPMVTALNHVVADGRRAGGLNLSSSILTDYRERVCVRESARRRQARCLPPRSYCFFERSTPREERKKSIVWEFSIGTTPIFHSFRKNQSQIQTLECERTTDQLTISPQK